jgi:anti-sigma regulatory factor (Ser/Thr protein kinase)
MTSEVPPLAPSPNGTEWAGTYALANCPRSPALARTLVRQALADCPSDVLDTAVLLTSELVTNAIRHAETEVVLTINLSPVLWIGIEDTSSDSISGRLMNGDADNGRGLAIVEALAVSWGWGPTAGGKRIWFHL